MKSPCWMSRTRLFTLRRMFWYGYNRSNNEEGKYKWCRWITLINVLAKVYSQKVLNRLVKCTHLHETACDKPKVLSTGNTFYCGFVDCEKCSITRSLLWGENPNLIQEKVCAKLTRALKSLCMSVKSFVVFYGSTDRFETKLPQFSSYFYGVCKCPHR